jgi:hypothetical protein
MPAYDTPDHAFMGKPIEPTRFPVADPESVEYSQIAGFPHFEESFFSLIMQQRSLDEAATAANQANGITIFNERRNLRALDELTGDHCAARS